MSIPTPTLELNEHTIGEALFAFADIPEELQGGAFIKQLDYEGAIEEIKYLATRVDESSANNSSSSEPPIKTYKIYAENTVAFKKELGEFLLGLLESALEGFSEGNELCPICKRINNPGECDTCEHHIGFEADGVYGIPEEIQEPIEELISIIDEDEMEEFAKTNKEFGKFGCSILNSSNPVSIMAERIEIAYVNDNFDYSDGSSTQLYTNDEERISKLASDLKRLLRLCKEWLAKENSK